jgi:hypothetical protein
LNRQDTVQKDNQPSVIEDLAINNEQATEVKGGRFIGVGELQETTISKSADKS